MGQTTRQRVRRMLAGDPDTSYATIAARVGMTRQRVQQIAREEGAPRRHEGEPTATARAILAEIERDPETEYREIARRVGINRVTVERVARIAGCPPRPRGGSRNRARRDAFARAVDAERAATESGRLNAAAWRRLAAAFGIARRSAQNWASRLRGEGAT